MWFVIGLFAGVTLGVFVAGLCNTARDPMDDVRTGCTGDCNQGRTCTCWPLRKRFDEESV